MDFPHTSRDEIPISLVPTHTKLSTFVLIHILHLFTEEFVDISFIASFIVHFIPKTWRKLIFYDCRRYFLMYGLIRGHSHNPFCKKFLIECINKIKPSFWIWHHPMLVMLFLAIYANSRIFNELAPHLHI